MKICIEESTYEGTPIEILTQLRALHFDAGTFDGTEGYIRYMQNTIRRMTEQLCELPEGSTEERAAALIHVLLETVFECIFEATNRQTVLLVARLDTEIVVSWRQGRFQMQLWVHNISHDRDALPVKRPHLQRLLDIQMRITFIAVEGCFTFVS